MKIVFSFLLLFLIGPSCVSPTLSKNKLKTSLSPHEIAREIRDLIKSIDPDVNIGIKIENLSSQKIVFEKNAKRHFIPASTIKLFTLAAALHYLGPSFRFHTTILSDSRIDKSGAINNLYLQGSGDPSLMHHDLQALLAELKQMGIKTVKGNIYVDDSVFDNVFWGPGAMWDDRHRGFGAPVTGLNLNYNRLLIKTIPSASVHNLAHILVTPSINCVEIISKIVTKNDKAKAQINLRVEDKKEKKKGIKSSHDGLHVGDRVILSGQITHSSVPHYHLLSLSDPPLFAGKFMQEQLGFLGIKVQGKVLRKDTPHDALPLVSHESRSLAEALIDFTKISNNIANDALIKAMAAKVQIKPASFPAGLKLVSEFLAKEVGIEPNTLMTADGAGSSRYNLVTPAQMIKLLTYVSNHFSLGPEFMAALPIGGEDGTLRARFKKDHERGFVRAKTGSMSGVSSLVGYLTGADNQRYAFAIMINGFIGNASKYLELQDKILATMLGNGQHGLAKKKT